MGSILLIIISVVPICMAMFAYRSRLRRWNSTNGIDKASRHSRKSLTLSLQKDSLHATLSKQRSSSATSTPTNVTFSNYTTISNKKLSKSALKKKGTVGHKKRKSVQFNEVVLEVLPELSNNYDIPEINSTNAIYHDGQFYKSIPGSIPNQPESYGMDIMEDIENRHSKQKTYPKSTTDITYPNIIRTSLKTEKRTVPIRQQKKALPKSLINSYTNEVIDLNIPSTITSTTSTSSSNIIPSPPYSTRNENENEAENSNTNHSPYYPPTLDLKPLLQPTSSSNSFVPPLSPPTQSISLPSSNTQSSQQQKFNSTLVNTLTQLPPSQPFSTRSLNRINPNSTQPTASELVPKDNTLPRNMNSRKVPAMRGHRRQSSVRLKCVY